MPRLVIATWLAITALSAAASSWTYASSDHFEIYTTGGERRAREALASFERVHAFFTDYMQLTPAPGRPTRLILFSGENEYKPYRANAVARAHYQASADRDWIVMSSLDADAQRIVVHEYVHLLVRQSNVAYPIWLNEGLAEFFSTIVPEGSKMAVGRVPVDRLQYLNTEARLIPLARLLAVEHNDPEYNTTAHAGTFYSESWALVHMLMTDPRYRANTHTFLDAVGRGEDAGLVMPSVFNKPLAAVQNDLEGYIRKQTYAYFTTPYKEPKISENAPVRTADGFEAGLVTANLLAATAAKQTEARAAFDALSQQKPQDVSLLESRAFFELRADNADAAKALFEQSINLGSTNAAAYREYATRFGLPLETAESILRKGLTLDPADLRLRLALASTQVRLRHGADALATLAPVKRVGPDDAFMLLELLANAHVLEQHWTEAAGAVRQAGEHARTPDEKQYAATLAQTISDYAARVAASEAMRNGAAAPASTPVASSSNGASSSSGASPSTPTSSWTVVSPSTGRAVGTSLIAMPPLSAVGRLKNMICGAPPILEIATAGGTLRLVIDDPLKIRVLGTGQVQTDLNCGPQDVPLKVGYEPMADRARNTVGNVRVLDFSVK
jgi:hypothetical protein